MKKKSLSIQSRITPDDPNYYTIMMAYQNCLSTLDLTQIWLTAFKQRGEKVPGFAIEERNYALMLRDQTILAADPNYDFALNKVRTRGLLGFRHTAEVTGNPILEELIGVAEIFSANLKTALGTISEPIAIPAYDSITGELQLNLSIGDVLTLTFPEQ